MGLAQIKQVLPSSVCASSSLAAAPAASMRALIAAAATSRAAGSVGAPLVLLAALFASAGRPFPLRLLALPPRFWPPLPRPRPPLPLGLFSERGRCEEAVSSAGGMTSMTVPSEGCDVNTERPGSSSCSCSAGLGYGMTPVRFGLAGASRGKMLSDCKLQVQVNDEYRSAEWVLWLRRASWAEKVVVLFGGVCHGPWGEAKTSNKVRGALLWLWLSAGRPVTQRSWLGSHYPAPLSIHV